MSNRRLRRYFDSTNIRPKPSPSPSSSDAESDPLQSPNLSPRKRARHEAEGDDELLDTLSDVAELELSDSPAAFESRAIGSISTNQAHDFLVHVFPQEEIKEYAQLRLQGESQPDPSVDDIPVRLLLDFTLYHRKTNKLVSLKELIGLDADSLGSWSASGIAKAWVNDLASDDDDDISSTSSLDLGPGLAIQLTAITEINVQHFTPNPSAFDRKIYLRTPYAWYIIDSPSQVYAEIYKDFHTTHELLHLILTTCVSEPRQTYKQFVQRLRSSNAFASYEDLMRATGECRTAIDFQQDFLHVYLTNVISNLRSGGLAERRAMSCIEASSLFRALEQITIKNQVGHQGASYPNDTTVKQARQEAQITILPKVGRIAQSLFERRLEVLGTSLGQQQDDEIAAKADTSQEHHLDPETMQWGQVVANENDDLTFYASITMDGVMYNIGNVVMVTPGKDGDRARAANERNKQAQSENSFGNKLWFARICYFFEEQGTKYFHGQWFVHGSKTILQETAHSKSLYVINECDDVPAAAIYKLCNLEMLRPGEEEVPDDFASDSNNFHCGLVWDELNTEFVDIPTRNEVEEVIAALPGHKPCFCCGLKAQKDAQQALRRIPRGFTVFGVLYHIGDCVYLKPSMRKNSGAFVLDIAQITKIQGIPNEPIIYVRLFVRFHDCGGVPKGQLPASGLPKDDRCLVRLSVMKRVSPNDLDGICYVRHLSASDEVESWVQQDDHFYFSLDASDKNGVAVQGSPGTFEVCELCFQERIRSLRQSDELLRRHQPLTGLELFAGAGGLGTGMDMSGFVETKYAIEIDPSAAESYRVNHPSTTVYCQDTNVLLRHFIDEYEGKETEPLQSLIPGDSTCAAMPPKGDVSFIFGGAPCQAFSLINHSRDPHDIRSTLVCNMLSYVEFYEPDYFLLENVVGLLAYRLLATKVDNCLVGGIEMGVVKLVQRTLIALGYQVKHRILQAAQYGAPQSRLRVIFWGAKRGTSIPGFPIPTHAVKKPVNNYNQPHGYHLLPVTRSTNSAEFHWYAPMMPVSVNDAIGDLPPFEWENPHKALPATPHDLQEARHRRKNLNIAQFNAVLGAGPCPGYPRAVPYACKPMNRYQKWLRGAKPASQLTVENDHDTNENTDLVRFHYTRQFGETIVERTVNIPLRPLADHKSLPPKLSMNKNTRSYDSHSFFGRLDGDGFFRTAMTQCMPNVKDTFLLHPSQKRMISIRESARAQGFPDYYLFASFGKTTSKVIEEQHRQIGNAVPVQLSLALGKSLGKALLVSWLHNEREGSPSV